MRSIPSKKRTNKIALASERLKAKLLEKQQPIKEVLKEIPSYTCYHPKHFDSELVAPLFMAIYQHYIHAMKAGKVALLNLLFGAKHYKVFMNKPLAACKQIKRIIAKPGMVYTKETELAEIIQESENLSILRMEDEYGLFFELNKNVSTAYKKEQLLASLLIFDDKCRCGSRFLFEPPFAFNGNRIDVLDFMNEFNHSTSWTLAPVKPSRVIQKASEKQLLELFNGSRIKTINAAETGMVIVGGRSHEIVEEQQIGSFLETGTPVTINHPHILLKLRGGMVNKGDVCATYLELPLPSRANAVPLMQLLMNAPMEFKHRDSIIYSKYTGTILAILVSENMLVSGREMIAILIQTTNKMVKNMTAQPACIIRKIYVSVGEEVVSGSRLFDITY